MNRTWTYAIVLVLAGLAVYANALWAPGPPAPMIFDDISAIKDNEHVHRVWPPDGLFATDPETPLKGRPVVALSFAVNWSLHGDAVLGYRVVNVGIHVLCGLVLFAVVRRTLIKGRPDRFAREGEGVGSTSELESSARGVRKHPHPNPLPPPVEGEGAGLALAVALLWLVHPINTETVNYITQRTESLMALFYLLTLYAAIRASTSAHRGWWCAASIAACALGMATKESMVTAPLIVVLYDWAYREQPWRDVLRQRWSLYAGLAATWFVLAPLMIYLPRSGTVGTHLYISAWTYLLNECWVIVRYLRLVFWPFDLLLDYGEPRQGLTPADVWWQGLIVLSLVVAAIMLLIRRPRLGFPAVWMFVILAPTSTVVPIVTEVGAERRMYLPLMGVVVLVVTGACYIARVIRRSPHPSPLPEGEGAGAGPLPPSVEGEGAGPPRAAALTLLVVVAALLGMRSIDRNADYRDRVALWKSVIRIAPDNPRGYENLGVAYIDAEKYQAAIDALHEAMRRAPASAKLFYNLGNALRNQPGKLDEALEQYRLALRVEPDHANARMHLAAVLAATGELDEAIEQYGISLDHNESAKTHYNLANALTDKGETDRAEHHYLEALRLDPTIYQARTNLARLYLALGKVDPAIEQLRLALRSNPHHGYALHYLGVARAAEGQFDEAAQAFSLAARQMPDFAPTYSGFGDALRKLGQLDKSIEAYDTALQIDPDAFDARNGLGLAMVALKRYGEAIEQFREAVRLQPDHTGAKHNLVRAMELKQQSEGGLWP